MNKFFAFLFVLAGLARAFSADIQLQWDASPDASATNVISYRIYYAAGTNSPSSLNVATNLSGTITNASPGLTYSIWVTASDTNNIESDPSNTVLFAVPDTFPSMPVLLSSKIVQTNKTFQIKVDWQPAPFNENVTGYKLDILQDGILSTNLFTTNTSAMMTVPVKKTQAILSATNYYGWGKSNIIGNWQQPASPRMTYTFLK